jgi:hypothetical protein
MWRILKAEIIYNKIWLIVAYSIALPTLIISKLWGWNIYQINSAQPQAILLTHQMIFFAFVFPLIMGVTNDRRSSKRTRFFAQLVLPVRKFGLIQIAIPLLFWISLVFIYWMLYLIGHSERVDPHFIWFTMTLTGFYCIVTASVLFYDLNYCLKKKNHKLIMNILGPVIFGGILFFYVFSMLPAVTSIKPLNIFMLNLSSSPLGSVILLFIGMLMVAFGLLIFFNRKSYTE